MHYIAGLQQKKHSNEQIILIVEDDSSIGEMLLEALSLEGSYRIFLVQDGFEALQVLHTIKPCLLITDYRLPSMNGMELYDHVSGNAALKNIPTILMSANLPPTEEIQKRHLISLSKPFELDEFLDIVASVLKQEQQSAS